MILVTIQMACPALSLGLRMPSSFAAFSGNPLCAGPRSRGGAVTPVGGSGGGGRFAQLSLFGEAQGAVAVPEPGPLFRRFIDNILQYSVCHRVAAGTHCSCGGVDSPNFSVFLPVSFCVSVWCQSSVLIHLTLTQL